MAPIISMSLNQDLLQKVDNLVQARSYSSRSEAIRDSIRAYLSDHELDKLGSANITATITAISGHESHVVDERLTRLRHDFDEIVTGNFHIHLAEPFCVEIFITEGPTDKVLSFVGKIKATRGIQQVKYTLVPIGERSRTPL